MSDYKRILEKAARICSNSEKCQHDIREKVIQWGLSVEDAGKAVNYLVENKFIDDSRFAAYFVRDKMKFNKWGRLKISYALRQKHIDEQIINNCLADINEEVYHEILEQVLKGKIRTLGNIKTANDKAKLLRFASQRGFTSQEIFDAIERLQ